MRSCAVCRGLVVGCSVVLLGLLTHVTFPAHISAQQSCAQTLSVGSDIAAAVAAAPANSTICLNNGNYGAVSLTNIARSSFVTLRSTNGVGAQMSPAVRNSDYIKLQSLTLSNASLTSCSTNVQILGNTFAPNQQQLSINYYSAGCSGNMALLVDGNRFIDGQATGQEGRLSVGAVNGLIISNNEFAGEPSSGAGSDGVQLWGSAANVKIGPGNVFHDISQAECDALNGAHCDPIQIYMGQSAGSNIVIDGNYFHDNSATLQNGNCDPQCPSVTFTNNVLKNQGTLFVSAPNVVFTHNTIYNLSVFDINWSGASTNTAFQSNIVLSSDDPNVASGTRSHNLCSTFRDLSWHGSDSRCAELRGRLALDHYNIRWLAPGGEFDREGQRPRWEGQGGGFHDCWIYRSSARSSDQREGRYRLAAIAKNRLAHAADGSCWQSS